MIILWFLSTCPGPPPDATLPAIDYSLAGRIGHALEPVFAPIGFNWQICVALIPGMAAREVAVSALGMVYAMSGSEDAIATQLGQVIDRKSVVEGKSVSVRVDLGGRRIIKKKT